MSKFNDFQTLLTAAGAYYYLGYSVIPLLGDFDPSRPKVAARSWTVYQQRLATLNEFDGWFSPQGGAAALGIVTGRISRLVVLDFDSPDQLVDFRRRCPDLLETRTIQSAGRGLPHLYFHLPSHLHLASQKRTGVDLLSDGRYVVAPPTHLNGKAYTVTRGGMPRPLTQYDIQRIQSFLSTLPSSLKEDNLVSNSPNIVGAGLIPPDIASNTINTASVGMGLRPFRSLSSPTPLLSPLSVNGYQQSEPANVADVGLGGEVSALPSRAALHGLYHYWRTKGGRNEALFRTALYARDHHMDETQTRRALSSLHISAPLLSPLSHEMAVGGLSLPQGSQRGLGGEETLPIRQREAYATIRSAFSRPPRISSPLSKALERGLGGEVSGLPNTVREALMQRKLTPVVRTLEGLHQAGFRAGKGFTADQAIQALKGIVGRDSVYNALNALAPNGLPFFPQRSPSALPPASKEAAKHRHTLKTKKCFFVTEKKSGIKKRGPKQRLFKIPALPYLCKLLGVKTSGSDPLTRDDLTSARQTRMALHRELIKRRPAEYTRRWLANRLGVSRRTINTYNALIPIHSQPTYHETTLSWANIDSLLTDEILAGSHIETLVGKKYPALLSIAKHLLAKGTYIRLKQRKGNLYWYGSDTPPPNLLPAATPIVPAQSSSLPRSNRGGLGRGSEHLSPSSVGKGLRPSRPLSSPTPLSVNGYQQTEPANVADVGLGVRFTPVSARPTASPSPAPLSVNGEGLGVRFLPVASTPLPPDQAESLAQTIYTRVNPSTDGTTRQLSLKNARKLVRTYTEKDIQFALNRLSQRTNLANPSGFFITVLRSTARQL